MVVATFFNGASALAGGSSVCYQSTGPCAQTTGGLTGQITCTSGFSPCFTGSLPTNTLITCSTTDQNSQNPNGATACLIIQGVCYATSNLYCSFANLVGRPTQTWLNNGQSVSTGNSSPSGTNVNPSSQQSASFFVTRDWTLILAALVAVAAITGVAIAGFGLNTATVFIIFMVSAMLAVWGILAALSGFGIPPAPTSAWAALDKMGFGGNTGFLGSGLFGIVSLIFLLNVLKSVSWGGE